MTTAEWQIAAILLLGALVAFSGIFIPGLGATATGLVISSVGLGCGAIVDAIQDSRK